MVEPKDFISALASAAATLCGLSLVFFGVLATREESHSIHITGNLRAALALGTVVSFFTSLISTVACVMWLFDKAHVTGVLRISVLSLPQLYDLAWISFVFTAVALMALPVVGFVVWLARWKRPSA